MVCLRNQSGEEAQDVRISQRPPLPHPPNLNAQQVRLGCNEGWRRGCSHYFLLIGADSRDDPGSRRGSAQQQQRYSPALGQASTSASGGGGIASSIAGHVHFRGTPSMLPPPSRSPRPPGLVPDVDSGAGENEPPSSRWVLRPQVVAGGKGSLAQAVRALVDEKRRSRAKSRSQLLPGIFVCVWWML